MLALRHRRAPIRRVAALALGLVLAQWLGVVHAEAHALEPQHAACAVCIASHHGALGILPAPPALTAAAAAAVAAAAPRVAAPAPLVLGFAARAPPA